MAAPAYFWTLGRSSNNCIIIFKPSVLCSRGSLKID